MKNNIQEILKKFWFVILVAVIFTGSAVFFAWDTNKDKIPSKSIDGEDIIFALGDDDYYTAEEYYNSLFNTTSNGTKKGVVLLYSLLKKEVVSQAVDTDDDMESKAEEIVEVYEQNWSQLNADYESFLGKQLEVAGYDGYEDIEEFFIDQLKADKLIASYIKDNPKVFDDVYKNKSPRAISHILVACKDPSNPTKEEKAKMEKIKKQLKDGKKFSQVAKSLSDDEGTKADGGSLGVVTKDSNLVAPFKEAAMKLKEKETSDWVKTEFGYHLIYAEATEKKTLLNKDKYSESIVSLTINESPNLDKKIIWEQAKKLGVEVKDKELKAELLKYIGVEK